MNIGQKIRGAFSSVFHRHTQAEDKTDWNAYLKAGTPLEYEGF
ncbi:MAG: hypothetical protein JWP52_3826 [Rhizobacter sp.]|nr:hypothetical protein [Rhizobacter sp.]